MTLWPIAHHCLGINLPKERINLRDQKLAQTLHHTQLEEILLNTNKTTTELNKTITLKHNKKPQSAEGETTGNIHYQ